MLHFVLTAGYDYKLGGPVMAQFPIQLIHQVMEPSGLADTTWPAQVELPLAKVLQQWMTACDVGGLDTLVVLLTHNRLCRADAATIN